MVTVRAMTAADWPRVEHILAEGIAEGEATFESTVPTWEQFDAGRGERHASRPPHEKLSTHLGLECGELKADSGCGAVRVCSRCRERAVLGQRDERPQRLMHESEHGPLDKSQQGVGSVSMP